jgi:hypothetical protein
MCFTRKKHRQKRKVNKKKIYPYVVERTPDDIKNTTQEEFLSECISCHNCKKIFNIGSEEIKIHCAGCNQFFHCGIAGKCRGSQCNLQTMIGKNHRLSWCVNCVPKIEGNEEKTDGIGSCICRDCSL